MREQKDFIRRPSMFLFVACLICFIAQVGYAQSMNDDRDDEEGYQEGLQALYPDSSNAGHRAGYRSYIEIPENSLEAVQVALTGKSYAGQFAEDFKYMEFDVRETFDQQLVIFHDKDLSRMLPETDHNKAVFQQLLGDPAFVERMKTLGNKKLKYSKVKIVHLTLEEIKKFYLKGGNKLTVPTFSEFLSKISEYKLYKPIAVEIKGLYTQKARELFHDTLAEFYNDVIVNNMSEFHSTLPPLIAIAFEDNFKDSFGSSASEQSYWCDRLHQAGAQGVFKCKTDLKVNLCNK